jgi:lipopolysaccharide/colanic/teichoic acid biosynthesis glycosyltransferase
MQLSELVTAELARTSVSSSRTKSLSAAFVALMARMRTQLTGGFVAATVLPAFLYDFFLREPRLTVPKFSDIYNNTFVGSTWAFLLGFLIFRKVTAFPGVRASAYVLPAFLVAYAITITGFFMLRLEYSRAQFLASFFLVTVFFYFVLFVVRRAKRLELALIPIGDVADTQKLKLVNWRMLSTPADSHDSTPVVVDLDAEFSPEWTSFIADCALRGRPVYSAKHVIESLSGRVQVQHLSENTFGSLMPNSIYGYAKRHCDFLLALLAVLVLFPVMALVAIAIRLETRGPAIFAQQRMGYRGQPFTLYKFRTMRVAPTTDRASREDEITRPNDARITRLGSILRRARLDELPQLFNILKGEMSWIGPRPEAMQLSLWYETLMPFYRYRHIVRPGLTGWAQVSQGHVSNPEEVKEKLQYDFFYVKHFSLWLDMLVVLRTIRVIVTGTGAK